jgi:hypothetical protein
LQSAVEQRYAQVVAEQSIRQRGQGVCKVGPRVAVWCSCLLLRWSRCCGFRGFCRAAFPGSRFCLGEASCRWRGAEPGEAEELEREPVRVPSGGAELGGDAGDAEEPERAQDGVADGGECLGRGGGAVPVLAEREVAGIVVHLYRPVASQVGEQVSGVGLVRGQAGDAEDGDRAEQFPVRAVAVPFDEEDLPDFRPFPQDFRRGRWEGGP